MAGLVVGGGLYVALSQHTYSLALESSHALSALAQQRGCGASDAMRAHTCAVQGRSVETGSVVSREVKTVRDGLFPFFFFFFSSPSINQSMIM